MNYEEVVKIGDSVGLHESHFLASFTWWQYVLYIGLFIVLSIICLWIGENFEFIGALGLAVLFSVMVIFLPIINAASKHSVVNEKNNKEIAEYKNKYGDNYINDLPVTKAEVFYIKIDAEAEVSGSLIFGTGSINSNLLTTMTVSYKLNGNGITETAKTTPNFDLVKGDTPYITYQELKKDLPHYQHGKYNFQIHLPENYSFTDIK
ncbi:hypothetical protein [Lysinibacillus sp. Bpr_S20]|uniref:hypothetical protein n=1 Tax=Lysinibacillus sp. Bpr_S20 TaxID=2933964 RepID=UPI002010E379|nr:hypothetical protein [Lysinibacillus sp. Bpr_S20]MCL1700760.1 hypothetical protein [Lysinibacillus sp. Bpr_S20]